MMRRNKSSAVRKIAIEKNRELLGGLLFCRLAMTSRSHFTAKFRQVGAIAQRGSESLILAS